MVFDGRSVSTVSCPVLGPGGRWGTDLQIHTITGLGDDTGGLMLAAPPHVASRVQKRSCGSVFHSGYHCYLMDHQVTYTHDVLLENETVVEEGRRRAKHSPG